MLKLPASYVMTPKRYCLKTGKFQCEFDRLRSVLKDHNFDLYKNNPLEVFGGVLVVYYKYYTESVQYIDREYFLPLVKSLDQVLYEMLTRFWTPSGSALEKERMLEQCMDRSIQLIQRTSSK